jgi:hypothetical protein
VPNLPKITIPGLTREKSDVSLYKAPQAGFGADQYKNGWNAGNLTSERNPRSNGGPLIELWIPFLDLPVLNQFPRIWHK